MAATRPDGQPVSATIVALGRLLRERGVVVGVGQLTRCQGALAQLDPTDTRDLYWAGRTCLVNGEPDLVAYDEAFAELFLADEGWAPTSPTESDLTPTADRSPDGPDLDELSRRSRDRGVDESGDDEHQEVSIGAVASPAELLRHKSFAECSTEEAAQIQRLLRRLRLSLPLRRSRRTRPGRPASRLDLRRTVRRSLRSHGELLRRDWRRRRTKPRNLVLLLDVSGSMTGYTRALLQFGHTVAATAGAVEVFCFGTRLTRVTRVLRAEDPDTALAQAADAVLDWDGGTRIGQSVRELLRGWGGQSFLRRSIVVICSDGLERGDPELLGAQLARLARTAHRIIWVNPLAGSPGYEPATRGMQAALPHIDHLVAGDTLASLEHLAALLGGVDT